MEEELKRLREENRGLKAMLDKIEVKVVKDEERIESLKSKYFDLFESLKKLEDQ